MKTSIPQILITFTLVCIGLLPQAQAVSPAPDGGYGGDNTAEGNNALFSLTTGVWNSAFGSRALYRNATGIRNTAIGYHALYNNNGSFNVAAKDNVAVGVTALFSNTTGARNIAIGSSALYYNTTGSNNIAIGHGALMHSTGSGNTAVGDSFASGPDVVSIGRTPTYDHGGNVTDFVVLSAFINAASDIYIGNQIQIVPMTTYTSRVHIQAQDAVYVGAVFGNAIAGSPVTINSNGQLGVAPSSKRFKEAIAPMDKASEGILALQPVSFRYNPEVDPKGTPQFGLVAEEVEKVNPDLVTRDTKGEVYTIRYEAVNAMLLNEFLKEHRKVEEMEKVMTVFSTQLKEQAAQIQRVSAQLQASRPPSKMVKNP